MSQKDRKTVQWPVWMNKPLDPENVRTLISLMPSRRRGDFDLPEPTPDVSQIASHPLLSRHLVIRIDGHQFGGNTHPTEKGVGFVEGYLTAMSHNAKLVREARIDAFVEGAEWLLRNETEGAVIEESERAVAATVAKERYRTAVGKEEQPEPS